MLTDSETKDLRTALEDYERGLENENSDDAAAALDSTAALIFEQNCDDDEDNAALYAVIVRSLEGQSYSDALVWVRAALSILGIL